MRPHEQTLLEAIVARRETMQKLHDEYLSKYRDHGIVEPYRRGLMDELRDWMDHGQVSSGYAQLHDTSPTPSQSVTHSRTLKRLVEQGFIDRPSKARVTITEKGWEAFRETQAQSASPAC